MQASLGCCFLPWGGRRLPWPFSSLVTQEGDSGTTGVGVVVEFTMTTVSLRLNDLAAKKVLQQATDGTFFEPALTASGRRRAGFVV